MKQFWKKTNRGLWLGLALLVFLAVFIVVKQVRFHMEKKEIKATAQEYVVDLLEVNRATGDAVGGELLTDGQKETQKAALEAVIAKYWYQTAESNLFNSINAFGLRTMLENWQNVPQNRVMEIELSTPEITVKGDGPGHASVSLYYNTFSLKVHGYRLSYPEAGTMVIFPNDYPALGTEYGDWTYTGSINVSLEMEQRKGSWYVTGMYFIAPLRGGFGE